MPETGHGWVEDHELHLGVRGGYDPPLTDGQSPIAAARDAMDSLHSKLDEQLGRRATADDAVAQAETSCRRRKSRRLPASRTSLTSC